MTDTAPESVGTGGLTLFIIQRARSQRSHSHPGLPLRILGGEAYKHADPPYAAVLCAVAASGQACCAARADEELARRFTDAA